jgi:hypothetical protein
MIKAIIAVCIVINTICLSCCLKMAGNAERYMESRKDGDK